jgi:hypothetical protein
MFQHAEINQLHSQGNRVIPGHGTGAQNQAANDDDYAVRKSPLWLVLSGLGNVIGGTLLLYILLILPQVIGEILS